MKFIATLAGRMLIFDGYDFLTRIIKLRPRQLESCIMCQHGQNSSNYDKESTKKILECFDYSQFCGVKDASDKTVSLKLLKEEDRISCMEYSELRQDEKHVLLDVRPKCQFNICALPGSINIPIDDFYDEKSKTLEYIQEKLCGESEKKNSSSNYFFYYR